jgi:hypothetical protein
MTRTVNTDPLKQTVVSSPNQRPGQHVMWKWTVDYTMLAHALICCVHL